MNNNYVYEDDTDDDSDRVIPADFWIGMCIWVAIMMVVAFFLGRASV